MSRTLRIGVVGGSIAGLTAGLLLRDLGHEVDIYERSAEILEGLGAGIIVHDETVRYFLERSSIPLSDISLASDRLQYLARDGSKEHEEQCPYRFTAWNSLFRGLLSLFDEERYHRSYTLSGITQDDHRVELRFAEGPSAHFDLVVCADGARSVGRRRLFGTVPEYSGYVGWRGIAGEDELSPETWETLNDNFTYCLLRDQREHLVAYPIPTVGEGTSIIGRRINFTWYRNVVSGPEYDELFTDRTGIPRQITVPQGLVQDRFVEAMHSDAEEHFPGPPAELVTRASKPFITAIVDAAPPRMAAGRVCLIGDAGVTARPHAAAGSAKAAADAWSLAEELSVGSEDPVEVLDAWQEGALKRGMALYERTRDMGARLQGPPGGWQPDDPSNRFGLKAPARG